MNFSIWLADHGYALTKALALTLFIFAAVLAAFPRKKNRVTEQLPCVYSIFSGALIFSLGIESHLVAVLFVVSIAAVAILDCSTALTFSALGNALRPSATAMLQRGVIAIPIGTALFVGRDVAEWVSMPLDPKNVDAFLVPFSEVVLAATTHMASATLLALGLFVACTILMRRPTTPSTPDSPEFPCSVVE